MGTWILYQATMNINYVYTNAKLLDDEEGDWHENSPDENIT